MSLDIKSDDINRYVADAIIKSAIGDAVKEQVGKAIDKLKVSYDNPLEKIIQAEVARIVSQMIQDEYKDAIKAKVVEIATEKTTDALVGAIVGKAFDEVFNFRSRY